MTTRQNIQQYITSFIDFPNDIFNIIFHYVGIEFPSKYGDSLLLNNILHNTKPPISDIKALHISSLYGHSNCLQLLLDYGFKPDKWSLRHSIRNRHYNCLELLLQSTHFKKKSDWQSALIEIQSLSVFFENKDHCLHSLHLLLHYSKNYSHFLSESFDDHFFNVHDSILHSIHSLSNKIYEIK